MLTVYPLEGSNVRARKNHTYKLGFNGTGNPSQLEGKGLLSAVQKGASNDMWVLLLQDPPNGAFRGCRFEMSCAAAPVDLKVQAASWNHASQTNVMSGAPSVDVVQANKTYERDAGSFLAEGFRVGQTVTWSGFVDGASNGAKTITVLTATIMTVAEAVGVNATDATTACSGVQEAYRLVLRFSKASDNTVVAPPAANADSYLLVEPIFGAPHI